MQPEKDEFRDRGRGDGSVSPSDEASVSLLDEASGDMSPEILMKKDHPFPTRIHCVTCYYGFYVRLCPSLYL